MAVAFWPPLAASSCSPLWQSQSGSQSAQSALACIPSLSGRAAGQVECERRAASGERRTRAQASINGNNNNNNTARLHRALGAVGSRAAARGSWPHSVSVGGGHSRQCAAVKSRREQLVHWAGGAFLSPGPGPTCNACALAAHCSSLGAQAYWWRPRRPMVVAAAATTMDCYY